MDLVDHQYLGNYRLVRLLGEGGSAQVYLGEHVLLRRPAAIKWLHERFSSGDIARFFHEARAIAHLEHPHIVRVLECDVAEGRPFLVMEYAPGGSLRERHPDGIPLALPTVERYVQQMAQALQYAHDQKLIHRDVKPENVLIGALGQLLLADFGFAVAAHSSSRLPLQDVGGTVAYMAPEQLQGKPRRASDQYALGAMVYEWLTGRPLFSGSVAEIITHHLHATPRSPCELLPGIPKPVEQVVLRALAKNPQARFPSVAAFADAFANACKDNPKAPIDASPLLAGSLPPRPEETPSPNQSGVLGPGGEHRTLKHPKAPLRRWPVPAPLLPVMVGKRPAVGPPPAPDNVPLKEPASHKRATFRWPLIRLLPLHLSLALLVLVLVAGGMLAWQVTRFQQTITTGKYITRIHVGTGLDPLTGALLGENDTFQVGTTVVLQCQFSGWNGYVVTRLFRGNTQDIAQQQLVFNYGDFLHPLVSFLSASARLATTGQYRWEVWLSGPDAGNPRVPEASITFQVISS